MNETAAPATAHAPRRHALPSWLAYLIFAFCAASFLLPFMRTLYVESDEGLFFCGAARIVQGQVFGREFLEIMGPGSFYWMAAFFKIFGVTLLAARISIFAPLLGTGLILFFLSRRLCSRYCALPSLLLTGPYFGLFGQVESHHVDSGFFALLSVVCLILWQTKRRKTLLIATGGLAAVTTCFLQPMGVFLLFACLLWLLLQSRKISSALAFVSLVTGGFLGVLGLVLSYFWSRGAMGGLIYANYIAPTQHYGPANTVPYAQRIFDIWNFLLPQPGGSKLLAGIAAIMEVPSLFVAALPVLLLILGIGYKWKSVRPEVVLLWLCGGAIWLSEFHRRDIHHLAYGSPLLIVLCVHMLGEIRSKFVHVAVWSLGACTVCLAALNCMVSAQVQTVPTRVGPVAAFGPGSGSVLDFLNKHTKPGEEILVYPWAPAIYFLSSTTNPTPYSGLFYGQSTTAEFHEVVDILEQRQVRYVVWDTTLLESRSKAGIMQGLMPSTDQLIFEPYLQSHYTMVENGGSTIIMERRQE